MAEEFTMSLPPGGNQFCCGKPIGCTNTSEQCSLLNHRWKLENITGHRERMEARREARRAAAAEG